MAHDLSGWLVAVAPWHGLMHPARVERLREALVGARAPRVWGPGPAVVLVGGAAVPAERLTGGEFLARCSAYWVMTGTLMGPLGLSRARSRRAAL